MKYKNNLSDVSNNSYFEVMEPFEVYIPVGKYLANSFVGSSQMFGVAYQKITLKPKDQIHDLFGGVFVSYQNRMVPVKMQLSDKHPFEKVYGGDEENFPIEKLKKIDMVGGNNYCNDLPDVPKPKKYFGRSIDSVIEY